MKLRKITELTEDDWVRELEYIDSQLTHVLDVFNLLEEVFRLSGESEVALGVFNTTPLFWNLLRDCFQESMFMGLGRICDESPDAMNVRRVLNGAMSHFEFFSEEALARRLAKRGLTDSLANYLKESAWAPDSGSDLRFLKDEVSCHLLQIETIYRPIRNSFYGHRVNGVDALELFEKTNRTQLWESLDMLRQLVVGLRVFYDNGARPRVDVHGTKALDLTPRRFLRDMVSAVAGREL